MLTVEKITKARAERKNKQIETTFQIRMGSKLKQGLGAGAVASGIARSLNLTDADVRDILVVEATIEHAVAVAAATAQPENEELAKVVGLKAAALQGLNDLDANGMAQLGNQLVGRKFTEGELVIMTCDWQVAADKAKAAGKTVPQPQHSLVRKTIALRDGKPFVSSNLWKINEGFMTFDRNASGSLEFLSLQYGKENYKKLEAGQVTSVPIDSKQEYADMLVTGTEAVGTV